MGIDIHPIPLRLSPGLPIFAEDLQEVKDSWKLLLDKGARMVYPAHGRYFSAEIIRKIMIKKENKYGKYD